MPFYVQIRRGQKQGLLAGPFDTREQAAERVPDVQREAAKVDPWAWFDTFGTVAVTRSLYGPNFPYGQLNAALGLPTAPTGHALLVPEAWSWQAHVDQD